MDNYEPELLYALDSVDEYADWKNVCNVNGDDVCFCPICLGRVKLWNGQNPNKTYQKQRCFHHIDGMCSQESRIHFAYKTWLLETGSKFKVNNHLYKVKKATIELTLKTKYGDYRPDIVIETLEEKTFYVEIAYTNKKTDEYILKWDELGNDVIEININEQLVFASAKEVPEFKLIYDSYSGKCFIKHYIHQDYDELLSERKIYWKRKDLINYKIKWEQLDWFWRILQNYYSGNASISDVCESFSCLDFEDQKFICSRFKNGKHKIIKRELENFYNSNNELKKVRLNHIGEIIRKLNKEFGYSSSHEYDDTYLGRKGNHIIFRDSSWWEDRSHIQISEKTTPDDIYDYFHPIMEKYYNQYTISFRKENEEEYEKSKELNKFFKETASPILKYMQDELCNCKNKMWSMSYYIHSTNLNPYIDIHISLANTWHTHLYIRSSELHDIKSEFIVHIKYEIFNKMKTLLSDAMIGDYYDRILRNEGK